MAHAQNALPHMRRERSIRRRDLLEPHRTAEPIEKTHPVAEDVRREMNQNLVAESGL
jgi:hypothetical protein